MQISSYIHVCFTNIDIVDGIDSLQVLQHADGSEKYIRVATGKTSWTISDIIDASGCWIAAASGGDCCPASSSNKKSDRLQKKSWEYHNGEAWVDADIRVTCMTHS